MVKDCEALLVPNPGLFFICFKLSHLIESFNWKHSQETELKILFSKRLRRRNLNDCLTLSILLKTLSKQVEPLVPMAHTVQLWSKLVRQNSSWDKLNVISLPTLECASSNLCGSEIIKKLTQQILPTINNFYFRFLDGEMRTITKEKGILETKRLDLDACKSRVRKARSMIGQQAVSWKYALML